MPLPTAHRACWWLLLIDLPLSNRLHLLAFFQRQTRACSRDEHLLQPPACRSGGGTLEQLTEFLHGWNIACIALNACQ